MKRCCCAFLALAGAMAACAADVPPPAHDGAGVDTPAGQAPPPENQAPVTTPDSGTPRVGGAPFDASWTVTETGFGPIRAGMGVAEAAQAVNGAATAPDVIEGCDDLHPDGWPEGVSIMIVDGRVARVDVRQGQTATTAGARIGSTETEIQALYPGQVEVRPHKYTDGHYLTVTPAGAHGTEHRIIFETDGERVVHYRAGALPAVEWVEGCA